MHGRLQPVQDLLCGTSDHSTGPWFRTGVVVSHGWPLNADIWNFQLKLVTDHGYRGTAHGRRGASGPARPGPATTWTTYADDLAALNRAPRPHRRRSSPVTPPVAARSTVIPADTAPPASPERCCEERLQRTCSPPLAGVRDAFWAMCMTVGLVNACDASKPSPRGRPQGSRRRPARARRTLRAGLQRRTSRLHRELTHRVGGHTTVSVTQIAVLVANRARMDVAAAWCASAPTIVLVSAAPLGQGGTAVGGSVADGCKLGWLPSTSDRRRRLPSRSLCAGRLGHPAQRCGQL